MSTQEARMTSKQKTLANSLQHQVKAVQDAIAALEDRVENFSGAHAEIAYRLTRLAHELVGNIEKNDILEIAKANSN